MYIKMLVGGWILYKMQAMTEAYYLVNTVNCVMY